MWMRVIALEGEIIVFKVEKIVDGGVDYHLGQRSRLPGELQTCLVEMIDVEVRIAEGMHEVAGTKAVTCAIICSSRAYEAILNGTPRKQSALRW